jgi:hypothetical protein
MIFNGERSGYLGVEFEAPREAFYLRKPFLGAIALGKDGRQFLRDVNLAMINEGRHMDYDPRIGIFVPHERVPRLAMDVLDVFDNSPVPQVQEVAALTYEKLYMIVDALENAEQSN